MEMALGLKFTVVDPVASTIPLVEFIKHFEQQPQYQVKDLPTTRKKELVEVQRTWKEFCEAIRKNTVGQVAKADVLAYHDKTMSLYHGKKYSTTWVRKRCYYPKWVLSVARRHYEAVKDLEQLRIWCEDLLVPLKFIPKKSAKLIRPYELHALLEKANVLEKAMIMLGINAAYGDEDIVSVPISAFSWSDKTLVYARKKAGKVHRSAMLWPETVQAVQAYLKTRPEGGETLFLNPETKLPYRKNFVITHFKTFLLPLAKSEKTNKVSIRN